ncbi:MAG: hypothetical protein HC841_09065 [Verrucomicrobiae bacterium]|nr:hypothetical protein [Verrucomicrobiae bacterium]
MTNRLRSMEPLASAVVFDDWEGGLRCYLGPDGAAARDEAILRAREILAAEFSPVAIGEAWHALIKEPRRHRRYGLLPGSPAVEIGVLLQSDADGENLLPLVSALNSRGDGEIKVIVAPDALRSRSVITFCSSHNIVPLALTPLLVTSADYRAFGTLDALVLAAQPTGEGRTRADALVATAQGIGVRVFIVEAVENGLQLSAAVPAGRSLHDADVAVSRVFAFDPESPPVARGRDP